MMNAADDAARYQENLRGEVDSASLYRALERLPALQVSPCLPATCQLQDLAW